LLELGQGHTRGQEKILFKNTVNSRARESLPSFMFANKKLRNVLCEAGLKKEIPTLGGAGIVAPGVRLLTLLTGIMLCTSVYAASGFDFPQPDQSDWSIKRIASYREHSRPGTPIAVIRVPSRNIEAAVYPDSVPMALEGGVAWVSTTPEPGQKGNVALAGHRDSFFRRLEGVPVGTLIELETGEAVEVFEVERVSIVDALDTSPLEQTGENVLSLVTCHPFYYQGYAPDRYIVRAKRIETHSNTTGLTRSVNQIPGQLSQ
jgi:LPXTG-site transpeptidase (sortase) family protein